jgi:hypothetical protein
MTEDPNYTPIVPQGVRVAQASARVLELVEERGTRDQAERIRQTFAGGKPPPANNPHWALFAAEAMATMADLVDTLMAEREPKRGRGRPPKNKPEEGDAA